MRGNILKELELTSTGQKDTWNDVLAYLKEKAAKKEVIRVGS